MTQLTTKIELYANKKIDFRNEVKLQDDGNGVYIKEWNLEIPKPTIKQLNAFEKQATIYEKNQDIINTRKSLYGTWEKQLEEIYDNGIDSWKERIQQIKLDNPKE